MSVLHYTLCAHMLLYLSLLLSLFVIIRLVPSAMIRFQLRCLLPKFASLCRNFLQGITCDCGCNAVEHLAAVQCSDLIFALSGCGLSKLQMVIFVKIHFGNNSIWPHMTEIWLKGAWQLASAQLLSLRDSVWSCMSTTVVYRPAPISFCVTSWDSSSKRCMSWLSTQSLALFLGRHVCRTQLVPKKLNPIRKMVRKTRKRIRKNNPTRLWKMLSPSVAA